MRGSDTEKGGDRERGGGDTEKVGRQRGGRDKGEVRQRQRGTETHKKGSLDREKEELRQ